jgi:hypothetical protein
MIAPCTTDLEAPAALKRMHQWTGSRKAYALVDFIPWYRSPTLCAEHTHHVLLLGSTKCAGFSIGQTFARTVSRKRLDHTLRQYSRKGLHTVTASWPVAQTPLDLPQLAVRQGRCTSVQQNQVTLRQTRRAASSSVGSRPSGVNLSTTLGRCWLSPFSMSSRDIPE